MDKCQQALAAIGRGEEVDKAETENLAKKRKLIVLDSWKTYTCVSLEAFTMKNLPNS